MTPQELEEQSKKAVIAYLQDSSVRLEEGYKEFGIGWKLMHEDDRNFNLGTRYYRIVQPKPWYRVALMSYRDGNENYYIQVVDSNNMTTVDTRFLENNKDFIKWLTDRVEYDNE